MSDGPEIGLGEPLSHSQRVLVAGLLLAGAAAITAGVTFWLLSPPRKADRLYSRAQKKIDEIEEILSMWPGG